MPEICPCPKNIIFAWDSVKESVDTDWHLQRFNIHPTPNKVSLAGRSGRATLHNCKANLFRSALIDFNAVRHYAQSQRLYLRLGFQSGDPIRKHPGQALDLRNPAAIIFSIENDLELHRNPP